MSVAVTACVVIAALLAYAGAVLLIAAYVGVVSGRYSAEVIDFPQQEDEEHEA